MVKHTKYLASLLIGALALTNALSMTTPVLADEPAAVPSNNYEVVEEMGLGYNLVGFRWYNPSDFEAVQLMNYEGLTKRIDKAYTEGFNTIRIPVCFEPHMDSDGHVLQDDTMVLLKKIVKYCTDRGLYVILCSTNQLGEHSTDPNEDQYAYTNGYHDRWTLKDVSTDEFKTEFETMWTDISEMFADFDYHVVFEPYNEPKNFGLTASDYGYTHSGNYNPYDSRYWAGRCGNLKDIMVLNGVFADIMRDVASDRYYMISSYNADTASAYNNYYDVTWENHEDQYVNSDIYDNQTYKTFWYPKGLDMDKAIYFCHVYQYGSMFTSIISDLRSKFDSDGIDLPIYVDEHGTHTQNFGSRAVKDEYVEPVSYMHDTQESGLCLWDDCQSMSYLNRETGEWYNDNLIKAMITAAGQNARDPYDDNNGREDPSTGGNDTPDPNDTPNPDDTPNPVDDTISENEPSTFYKVLHWDNNCKIYYDASVDKSLSYNGKNHNKAEEYKLYVEYEGQIYSGNDIKLKVKNAKNAGRAHVKIKKLNGVKGSNRVFKNIDWFEFPIWSAKIKNCVTDKSQYSQDGDYILKLGKDNQVKKISVLFKNPKNGKIYSKSVPKKMQENCGMRKMKLKSNFGGYIKY